VRRDAIDRLSDRVNWLDRWRRYLAIGVTLLFAPTLLAQLGETLGEDWPAMHVGVLAVMIGTIVWWCTECALAWLTAVWEMRHERLCRERDLPRAIVLPLARK
jgi:hypothetical protein